jgi:hypothetical protein
MAGNPVWDAEKLSSNAARIGAREPRASTATRGMEGPRAAPAIDRDGPTVLGLPIEGVGDVAAFAARGAAGNGGLDSPECLDHVVVIGERHLLRILSRYLDYYNATRTHLSLAKDAPDPRRVQWPSQGRVVAIPRVGGLHHEYQGGPPESDRTNKWKGQVARSRVTAHRLSESHYGDGAVALGVCYADGSSPLITEYHSPPRRRTE